jgi:2-dehydro-3-deoxyphosphogluconate aldolase/(4S)-4-hydroxy-2-oxoglutarate aldolase
MSPQELREAVIRAGVVPVVVLDDPNKALPLADAILEGGLPVLEITFRTAAAAEIIRRIAAERPRLIVGAGTVLTRDNAESALRSGAQFAVAPGLNPATVRRAKELDLPFIPGVATASEIEQALHLDCPLLKFFPAELLGGPAMIKALYGPFAHTGVRFMPTGSITLEKLDAYLKSPAVAAVGGSWITPPDLLQAGNWPEITARARQAAEHVAQIRAK